jgi:transcriptional regulator with XRE-family HTH domain
MMGRTLEEKLAGLSPERRARIAARTEALIAEEKSLSELRRARALTQKSLAKKLGIGQESISKLESRSDLMLSTLRNYVEAMGGSLDLVAKFPDAPPVSLSGFNIEAGVLAASAKKPQRKASHKAR